MKSTIKALAISLIAIPIIILLILPQMGCSLTKQVTKEAVVEVEPKPTEPVFAYEGPVNPNDFDKWEIVASWPGYYGYVWKILENPDPDAEIKHIGAEVDLSSDEMVSYRFWIEDEPNYYVFDEGKYRKYSLTEDHKQHCMSCHQDKIQTIKRSI